MDKLDIVLDQVNFVSKLLLDNDLNTLQHVFQNCQITITQINQLENNIKLLNYSVLAREYEDGIKYANDCRTQFDIYKNYIDKYYINAIYKKYQEILIKIKSKLLDEFDIVNKPIISTQLKQASDLLNLLSETERTSFLLELSKKVCVDIPNGEFHQLYKEQLEWIFIILDDEEKYKVLNKWNFKKYIIETWADIIRNNILKVEIDQISTVLINYTNNIEKKLSAYLDKSDVTDELINVAFDFYYNSRIQQITELFKMPTINFNCEQGNTVLISATELVFILRDLDSKFAILSNKRNIKMITYFYESSFSSYLAELLNFYKTNLETIVNFKDSTFLKITKDTIDYLQKICQELKHKYLNFNINGTKLEHYKKEIYNLIYLKYKQKCLLLIYNSVEKYQNNFVDSLKQKTKIGTASNKFNNNKLMDISQEINELSNIIKDAANIDNNLGIYILNEINLYYKISLDPSSNKYNKQYLDQIYLDVGYLKDKFKNYSIPQFTENQNKINLLLSDVDNESIFVEQFKVIYKDHNLELLKQILKYKNVDEFKFNNILKIYDPKYKKGMF